MLATAIAAFVGCFSALFALAEIQAQNKIIRYLGAFIVGALVTVLLALLLAWVAATFARMPH